MSEITVTFFSYLSIVSKKKECDDTFKKVKK